MQESVAGKEVASDPEDPAGRSARQAPNGDSVVVLEDVVKRFGAVVAVDRLNLKIRRGEFFSMLGPSGCGKTTTLRMIGGFEAPSEGMVRLDGQDVTSPSMLMSSTPVWRPARARPSRAVSPRVSCSTR